MLARRYSRDGVPSTLRASMRQRNLMLARSRKPVAPSGLAWMRGERAGVPVYAARRDAAA
jgi:hypothetical protein